MDKKERAKKEYYQRLYQQLHLQILRKTLAGIQDLQQIRVMQEKEARYYLSSPEQRGGKMRWRNS